MVGRISVAIFLFAAAAAHADECRSIRLDGETTRYVVVAAQQVAERRISERILGACQHEDQIFAQVGTVRETQFDGSIHWESVECQQQAPGTQVWDCTSMAYRSAPLAAIPQLPVSEVTLLLDMKVEDAEPLVKLVYAALPGLTDRDACTQDEKTEGDANAMRRSFIVPGQFDLTFYSDEQKRGVMLERKMHRVLLQADPGSPGQMRVKCWDERAVMDDG